jgi:hypothetical protein
MCADLTVLSSSSFRSAYGSLFANDEQLVAGQNKSRFGSTTKDRESFKEEGSQALIERSILILACFGPLPAFTIGDSSLNLLLFTRSTELAFYGQRYRYILRRLAFFQLTAMQLHMFYNSIKMSHSCSLTYMSVATPNADPRTSTQVPALYQ